MKTVLVMMMFLFAYISSSVPTHAGDRSRAEIDEFLKVLAWEDIHRFRQILIGVGNGEISINREDIRLEFHQIVDRMGEADGNREKGKDYFFKVVRRVFVAMNPYMKLFWLDALTSLQEGRVFKSVERTTLEKKYLREGLLNTTRVEMNETLLQKIALKEPMVLKGSMRTFDIEFIKATLDNIDGATKRYEWLFSD